MSDFTYTVSHATLRLQDLIPSMLHTLEALDPGKGSMFTAPTTGHAMVPSHALEDEEADWWASEDATGCLESITLALEDACAGTGLEFTTLEGDGSHFVIRPAEIQHPWDSMLGEFELPFECCDDCTRPGQDASDAVAFWLAHPEVGPQFTDLDREDLERFVMDEGTDPDEAAEMDLDHLTARLLWGLCHQVMGTLEDSTRNLDA